MKKKKIIFSAAGAVIAAALTLGIGLYAQRVMNPSELVHFFIPFPAGRVTHPMTVKNPAGGQIFTRPLTINVDERGILKRIFNPGIEGIGTHWLVNVDTKPHRVGLRLSESKIPIEWLVGAGIPWDAESKTFSLPVPPGERIPDLGIDWHFYFSEEIRKEKIWYQGVLTVFDADTNENLTTIPITFQQKKVKCSDLVSQEIAPCCQ